MTYNPVPYVDPFQGGWVYSKPPDPSGIGLSPTTISYDPNNWLNIVNPPQYTPVSPDVVLGTPVTVNDNLVNELIGRGSGINGNNMMMLFLIMMMMEK